MKERMQSHLSATQLGRIRLAITASVIGGAGVVYLASPTIRGNVNAAVAILAQGDVDALRNYIMSFGPWAPLISLLLMVLQSLVAPLPAFLLAFANGLAFGVFWGGLLTFVSALLAAVISFWIGRGLGRSTVELLVGVSGVASADAWFVRHGAWAILIARLVPIVSFDAISYAAGLTGMRFRWFLAATALGIVPATFLYAFLGERAPQTIVILFAAFGVIALLGAIASLRRYLGQRALRAKA